MTYPLTFYVNSLPPGVSGRANGPIIRILKSRKGDEGLYQHELTHVKQAFLGLFIIHALLYKLLPEYRLWAEVQAYKKQAKYYPDDRIPLFAAAIATRYNLKISKENAEALLRE
jgi:hypothetical protein